MVKKSLAKSPIRFASLSTSAVSEDAPIQSVKGRDFLNFFMRHRLSHCQDVEKHLAGPSLSATRSITWHHQLKRLACIPSMPIKTACAKIEMLHMAGTRISLKQATQLDVPARSLAQARVGATLHP